ncbi:PREDICTED: RNA exonuclease 4 isoform X2 [Wasmannia auropunctata]|uniref:RNA exonuclease 4 isoform X2 n=1 Tax=Wasmannia auropunctata TaxID=64793 RepID=UPI0005EEA80B|nr:PREDICTED: RNA exonuclease 4 isoform X2 [Wasmannia auropunctata]
MFLIVFACFVVWMLIRMDNVPTSTDKKKRSKTTRQPAPSTERKASGCNWETYKNFFSKAKTEESAGEKSVSQNNRHPRLKKVYTTPPRTDSQEESGKQSAVKNNKENKTLTKQLAMDCEMVGIGDGTESMIARVSIVNKYGDCVYDKYVKPREKVVDYRTAISGVRPEHLQSGESFSVVQKEVADILKGRILVGHALKHDLKVLYLSHPRRYWRDTSRYKPFRQISKGNTPSLKRLAHELLGREIQVGEHSSVEDARAAMQLYMLYRNKWESERKH